MKTIITAIGNPTINEKLKTQENIKILGSDIQYQEGIFEFLEKETNIDFILISEKIKGILKIQDLIQKIKLINKKIKIILILENKNIELENILIEKGIYKIIYNNQIEIKDLINIINKSENTENEELKKEIDNLKKLILENNSNKKKNKIKKLNFKKFISKVNLKVKLNNKKIDSKNSKKENINKSNIISIIGTNETEKSIVMINLAKTLAYKQEKILIFEFDILNNNLNAILGEKKYFQTNKTQEINYELKQIKISKFIIKVNKKIDLISITDLLFNSKEKLSFNKIEKMLNSLKEKYNLIIVDTSSEYFLDITKSILDLSNSIIFITQADVLELTQTKGLLDMCTQEWNIDKKKINILFSKYDKDNIKINSLKNLFDNFNIIGILNYNSKYNKLTKKNIKNNFCDKKIKNEYMKIKSNLNKII